MQLRCSNAVEVFEAGRKRTRQSPLTRLRFFIAWRKYWLGSSVLDVTLALEHSVSSRTLTPQRTLSLQHRFHERSSSAILTPLSLI